MRRLSTLLSGFVLMAAVAACGQPTITTSLPAASGAAVASGVREQPSGYGVLVDLLSDPKTYTLSAVSWNGTVAGQVKASRRTLPEGALELPYVSASQRILYYLDGDQQVREFELNGSAVITNPVLQLNVPPGSEAVFAVSPGDEQIAVSVIDFTRTPAHLQLYTQPMPYGDHHVIFESDTDYVWPVAWHNRELVLAHGYGVRVQDALKAAPGQDNPYWAISYHVVNPNNAIRTALVGQACTVSGPLSLAGSACIQGGTVDWAGANTNWSANNWGSISSAASLSPNGLLVAAAPPDNQTQLTYYKRDGSILYSDLGPGPRDWAGWLDDTHVIVGSAYDLGFQVRVDTLTSAGPAHTYPPVKGFYAARVPADIT